MCKRSEVILGDKIGRLTIIRELEQVNYIRKFICKCDCGKEVVKWLKHLRHTYGRVSSCGCVSREMIIKQSTTHNKTYTITYGCWLSMRRRCYDKKMDSYPRYGGRGIVVSEDWMNFENFIRDMGERPSTKHSIDRIDLNGNYEKGNCRWATQLEQGRNKSTNRIIEYNGELKILKDWANELGVDQSYIGKNIRAGKSMEYIVERIKKRKK